MNSKVTDKTNLLLILTWLDLDGYS